MELSSTNITAAAVIAQFLILIVLVVTSQIMGRLSELWVPFYRRDRQHTSYSLWLLLLTLLTLGLFFFSDVFVQLWRPLLGHYDVPFVPWSRAISAFILSDIICITLLVLTSGGSRLSPFTPLYGLMPVIAILLREPTTWVLVYAASAIAGFTIALWGVAAQSDPEGIFKKRDPIAIWFVTTSSILLATAIGIITIPN